MSKIKKSVFYFILAVLSLINLYPIYFTFVSSFKENKFIFSEPFSLPKKFLTDNYVRAFTTGNMGRYFLNTSFLTVVTIVLSALLAAMVSYMIARIDFKFKKIIYILFVAGMMIPVQSTIIPLAFGFGKLHINDNYLAMILLYTAFNLPMSVFILTGFMKAIPRSLEEAAIIDGCTTNKIFWNIILPLSAPALATVSIFNFLASWNNLLFPLVLIRDKNLMTISYGLLNFFSFATDDYGGVLAAGVISMLPPFIIYILLQEKVEKGLTAGALKG